MSHKIITLYILRHGEIEQKGVLAGHTDFALSKFGLRKMAEKTAELDNISHCISSPLKRCVSFAEYYCQNKRVSLTIEPDIQEMNFGEWDGQPFDLLWSKNNIGIDEKANPDQKLTIGDFWENPWQVTPPKGESMEAFTQRIHRWWQSFLEQYAIQGKDKNEVLVISHAGVIKYLIASVLNISVKQNQYLSQIDVPYGCLTKFLIFIDEQGKPWPKLML